MQCFLNRLSRTEYWEKFILKGGMVFSALSIPYRRSTRDLDFQGMLDNDKDSLTQVIKQICDVEVEYDGVEFDLSSIMATEIRLEANYPGIRIQILGIFG